jgi:pyruvate dehydrogenase E1 component alpha subunit
MAAKATARYSRETLLSWYYEMVLVREFEDQCYHLYFNEKDPNRKITGVYLHLASGSEATHVGAVKALEARDHVITAYRDHGIALARGVEANRIMAEMLGRKTGVSGGKGGSMHLASREHNFWGGYAIVGGHLPLAAGIAFASQYRDEGAVVLSFLGDGASNNGYFHEAVNLSGAWKLPVIWLIENNGVGMGTRIEDASAQKELVKRAIGYGIKEGPRVDGQDFIKVYEAVQEAAAYARAGNGPVLMEALTYRYQGHGVSDKQYNEREDMKAELEQWRMRDPIESLRRQIVAAHKDAEPAMAELDARAKAIVAESVEFAAGSPVPDYNDLINNIYVGDIPTGYERQG